MVQQRSSCLALMLCVSTTFAFTNPSNRIQQSCLQQQQQPWETVMRQQIRRKLSNVDFSDFEDSIMATSSSSSLFSSGTSDGDGAPSDYDTYDLASSARNSSPSTAVVSEERNESLRKSLKADIFNLAAMTNRGQHANTDEQNRAIDLIIQMEALNPTVVDPAAFIHSEGDWQMVLTLTQPFRVSPFFQSIRERLGSSQASAVETGFDIHDYATTASRICRVRQSISKTSTSDTKPISGETALLTSEVELHVGAVPGLPLRIEGTVLTTANVKTELPRTWVLKIEKTVVKQSNIPFVNQWLDDPSVELPWNRLMEQNPLSGLLGSSTEVPAVRFTVTYVDDSLRILRDVDDHFYVFSRQ